MTRIDRCTVCITTASCADINRHLLVVVAGYTHWAMCKGRHVPYRIARLDRLPIPMTRGMVFYQAHQVQARHDQLQPLELLLQVLPTWRPTGMHLGVLA